MAEKSAPKPEEDTYSDEEIAKRMDVIVRAMIGMKPKPRRKKSAKKESRKQEKNCD